MSFLERECRRAQFNKMTPGALNKSRIGIGPQCRRDYRPLLYKDYFDEFKDLKIEEDIFRVYLKGFNDQPPESPIIFLLHGGGYSGLTWSLFAKHISSICVCRIVAVDLRGHGSTKTSNDYNLSAVNIVNDISNIYKCLLSCLSIDEHPAVVLAGHSMGGALAVHCANKLHEVLNNILGVIVIDVVEGTALDALDSMQSFLRGRPKTFLNLENAIEWWTGQTKNLEAARVSMPGQLKNFITNTPATEDIPENLSPTSYSVSSASNSLKDFTLEDQIAEEAEDDTNVFIKSNMPPPMETLDKYTWRIDLTKTEPYWKGWFEGLSNLFLSCPVPGKLLLLAGIDRLDKVLTIGQMQGKFQMQVLPQCGHAVHEDVPEKVAEAVATFLVRNRFTVAVQEFERTFPSC